MDRTTLHAADNRHEFALFLAKGFASRFARRARTGMPESQLLMAEAVKVIRRAP